jgi:hypothetical protein
MQGHEMDRHTVDINIKYGSDLTSENYINSF